MNAFQQLIEENKQIRANLENNVALCKRMFVDEIMSALNSIPCEYNTYDNGHRWFMTLKNFPKEWNDRIQNKHILPQHRLDESNCFHMSQNTKKIELDPVLIRMMNCCDIEVSIIQKYCNYD